MNGYDPHTLLDLVGEIVRLASPDCPQAVTQAVFDRTAGAHERFARVPPARSLTRFYLQNWRDLVELSLRDSRSRAQTLAMRGRVEQTTWLTAESAVSALRVVCRRMGGVAPSRQHYRRERQRLIEAANGSAAIVAETLPTENQIESVFGDWASALAQAGIHAEPDRPALTAPSVVDLLERCYEHHHAQPTVAELELFAQANGIPFPRRERGQSFAAQVVQWKERRLAVGEEVPDGPPRKRDRPDYGVDVGASLPGERRAPRRWTSEALDEWVDRFLWELPAGRRPTQRVYADWARATRGAPSASTLISNGGFSASISAGRARGRLQDA